MPTATRGSAALENRRVRTCGSLQRAAVLHSRVALRRDGWSPSRLLLRRWLGGGGGLARGGFRRANRLWRGGLSKRQSKGEAQSKHEGSSQTASGARRRLAAGGVLRGFIGSPRR
ncbi:MAG: hypothetical protein HC933_05470 [Pleurocapsa sp. SU_196_0]|nr:hypothetical protein [Pleurocapsa sp. SU_196_0]